MAIKIQFNPLQYELNSDLQEKLKLKSPILNLKASLEVYAVVQKQGIYYSGKTAIQGDDVSLYITRPNLILVTDDNGQELSAHVLKVISQMKGITDLVAQRLQKDLESGNYDEQILNQRDKSSKHKITAEEINSGNLIPSPLNGLRTPVIAPKDEISNRDLIYDLMRSNSDQTVGELTESFNQEYETQLEEKMPRNEIAKLVSSLKNEGLVRPLKRRICTVAGRDVLTWTTDMSLAPTEEVIQMARKKMEDAKERLELVTAEYNSLLNQAKLGEDSGDQV